MSLSRVSVCVLSVCVSVSVRSQVVCGKQWPLFGPLSTSREILNDFSSLPGREKLYRRYWQKKKAAAGIKDDSRRVFPFSSSRK